MPAMGMNHAQPTRPVDRLGRQIPHQLNALAFVQGIPGFADQFKPVPDGYVDENRIACPCGETVLLEPATLTGCPTCERIYLAAGRGRAYVGYGPTE